MSPTGKILGIYPEGRSTVYSYLCRGEDDRLLSFPVEFRYHMDILENEGNPVGWKVEYRDDIEPPTIRFLD